MNEKGDFVSRTYFLALNSNDKDWRVISLSYNPILF